MAATTVLVPMQSSAFILNEKVCAPELDVKIAPISQPNYTFLRLSNNPILPDILDRHDLHHKCITCERKLTRLRPGSGNSSPESGWSPSALESSQSVSIRNIVLTVSEARPKHEEGSGWFPKPCESWRRHGSTRLSPGAKRFLVIQRLTKDSIPANLPSGHSLQPIETWVIESDRIRHLEEFEQDTDLETEAAPFIEPSKTTISDPWAIEGQAEVFLGCKTRFDD